MAAPAPQQEILYALVARKNEEGGAAKVMVLSEFATTTGNFQSLARKICEKLPANQDTKYSFSCEGYIFDVLIENGIIYMCMIQSDGEGKQAKRLPFAFLKETSVSFARLYSTRLKSVTPTECYESFAGSLRKLMDYYNKNPNLDKVDTIRKDVAEVKEIMVQNVDELLKRGEKLKVLVDKTDELQKESATFKKRTTELKDKMWWRNCKMTLIIIIPVTIGAFWALFWLCGGIDFCNCQTCASKVTTVPGKPGATPPPAKPGGKRLLLQTLSLLQDDNTNPIDMSWFDHLGQKRRRRLL